MVNQFLDISNSEIQSAPLDKSGQLSREFEISYSAITKLDYISLWLLFPSHTHKSQKVNNETWTEVFTT